MVRFGAIVRKQKRTKCASERDSSGRAIFSCPELVEGREKMGLERIARQLCRACAVQLARPKKT